MTDRKDDSPADLTPVLTEPAATGAVPVLTDAVVGRRGPVGGEPTARAPPGPPGTVGA